MPESVPPRVPERAVELLRRYGRCRVCGGSKRFDHGAGPEVFSEECETGSFGERPVPHRYCPCNACGATGLEDDVREFIESYSPVSSEVVQPDAEKINLDNSVSSGVDEDAMIEAAARAHWEHDGAVPIEWEKYADDYRSSARIHLEAMRPFLSASREPTPEEPRRLRRVKWLAFWRGFFSWMDPWGRRR